MAGSTDIGIRVLILGVGEARRSLGSVRSDISGLESEIRKVSGTSINLGKNLTQLGSTLVGVGRTMTLALTTPLLLLSGSMVRAGIEFEDTFAGVTKTVDGVSVGFRDIAGDSAAFINFWAQLNKMGGPGQMFPRDTAFDMFITQMSEAQRQLIFTDERFGQLTEDGIKLRDGIRELALEIPITTSELNGIAQAAGQLGIPLGEGGEILLEFTRLMAELGVATDLTAEDAAMKIARFATIFQVSSEDMIEWTQSFGAALVGLGNNTAATESEILSMATRLAAAGTLTGLTEQQVLALAATMVEVGVAAERGGSSLSRVMTEIRSAVAQGGEDLEIFATVAGQTSEEFATMFGEGPYAAIGLVTRRFKELFASGELTDDMLISMGFSGVRVQEVLSLLGIAEAQLADNLTLANTEWDQQLALEEEAAKRFATTKSQIQLLKNAFTDLSITIFDLYSDDINRLVESLKNGVTWFKGLEEGTQRTILKFLALGAALGPITIGVGLFLQNAGLLVTTFGGMVNLLPRLVEILLALAPSIAALLVPVGLVAAAFATDFLGIRSFVVDVYNAFIEHDIAGQVMEIVNNLTSGNFTTAIDQVKALFIDMWAAISRPFAEGTFTAEESAALGQFSPLGKFKDSIEEGVGGIKSFLDENAGPFIDQINILFDGVQGFVTNFTEQIDSEMLQSAIDNVGNIIVGFVGLVMSVVGDIAEIGGKALPLLGTALGDFANAILGILGGASIKSILTDIAEGVMSLVNAMGQVVLGEAEAVVNFLVNIAAALLDLVGINIDATEIKDTIVAPFFDAVSEIWNYIFGTEEPALSWTLSNIVTSVVDALTNLPGAVYDSLTSPFITNVGDIDNKLQDRLIGDALGGLPGRVITGLRNLATALQNALVDPFFRAIDAILAKIGELVGGVGQVLEALGLIGGEAVTMNTQASQQQIDDSYAMLLRQGYTPEQARAAIAEQYGIVPITGHARGGLMSGWGLVGEQGPELAFANSPTTIIPNTLTNKILAAFNTGFGIQENLLRTLATQRETPAQNSSVYSPNFYGPPNRDAVRANRDMYDQYLIAQQVYG